MFAIERYDIATGERTQVAGGPGGAVRPTPSPDGRWLAYVHRTGGRSRLFVKDLRSGEERQVYADLDLDLQETWAVHGVYPNMDWTPDSSAIVFWAGGKIRRVNRDGSRRRRNPVPGQRHPRRDRSAAAADRRRAGDRHHPDAALRRGLAGRQPGRLRDARPALRPRPCAAARRAC